LKAPNDLDAIVILQLPRGAVNTILSKCASLDAVCACAGGIFRTVETTVKDKKSLARERAWDRARGFHGCYCIGLQHGVGHLAPVTLVCPL
jgi:hypothetical protein